MSLPTQNYLPSETVSILRLDTSRGVLEIPLHRMVSDAEPLTWYDFEIGGRRWRYTVRGVSVPFEVCYLFDFGLRGNERSAFFPIAPEHAADSRYPEEQQVYAQIVEMHRAEMQQRGYDVEP
jgi:hypothetical protein